MVPFLSIARAMLGGALGLLAMIPALANPVAFDPHGKRIGLNVGSEAVDYVERHYPDAKILLFQAPADTIAASSSEKWTRRSSTPRRHASYCATMTR